MYLNEYTVGLMFRDQAGPAVELVFHNMCKRLFRKPGDLLKPVNGLAEKHNLIQRFVGVGGALCGDLEFTLAKVPAVVLPESNAGYSFMKQRDLTVPLGKRASVHIEVASVVVPGKGVVGYVEQATGPNFVDVRASIYHGVNLPINFASVYQAGAYLAQQGTTA